MTEVKPKLQELPVKVLFNPLAIKSAELEAKSDLEAVLAARIETDEDAAEWAANAREIARQKAALETMRKGVTGPLDAAKKAVDALFAPARETLAAIDAALRKGIGDYSIAKAQAQRAAFLAAGAAANAGRAEEVTTALQQASAAAPQKLEGVSTKPVWQATVIAADLVPYDWCMPDEKKIAAYTKTVPAERTPSAIPGVKFELVAQMRVSK